VAIGKTTVTVFPEGVRRSSVLGVRELLWSDIAEYRYQIIRFSREAVCSAA
jgi:hypothetical protein